MNQPLLLPESVVAPQPQAPTLGFQVSAEGATFVFNLGNGLSIQQAVDAATMQELCKVWLESRKQLMAQQQLIADVMRTKR